MNRIANNSRKSGAPEGQRGVALLIVLVVTALLIALIFEFAYATRISLNSAINFRDSQRAYFLARSGVYLFAKYPQLQDNLPEKQLSPPLPIVSSGDTVVRVRWEDEAGKISIPLVVQGNDAYKRLQQLFIIKEIDQAVLDQKIVGKKTFALLSELHEVMTDEEYAKVKDYLTVAPIQKININTASLEVLQCLCRSLGKDDGIAGLIIARRIDRPFSSTSEITNMPGMEPLVASYLDWTSNTFTVFTVAAVGGYSRNQTAIITKNPFAILYWSLL